MAINPKNVIKMIKEIPLKSKHMLWNTEISKDNFFMDIPLARYYFAIVDKRDAYRKDIANKLVEKMTKAGSTVMQIESPFEMKVKNSEWGLLFVVYDALVKPEMLNLENLNIIHRRDHKLSGKKVLDIEDYLTRIYE
jgi:hypothetical protein